LPNFVACCTSHSHQNEYHQNKCKPTDRAASETQLLGERGARLGLSSPRQFFWVTGALSSFLDNTPTYVALSAAASSLHGTDPQVRQGI